MLNGLGGKNDPNPQFQLNGFTNGAGNNAASTAG